MRTRLITIAKAVSLIVLLTLGVTGARADEINLPVSIFQTDPSLNETLPGVETLYGKDAGFKSNEGLYYNLHGGAQTRTSASYGSSVGYNLRYIGVELDFNRTRAIDSAQATNSTGAKIFLQYPVGSLTPYVSFGMSEQFVAVKDLLNASLQRSVGVGANYALTPDLDLTASVTGASVGTGSVFKTTGYTLSYSAGLSYRF